MESGIGTLIGNLIGGFLGSFRSNAAEEVKLQREREEVKKLKIQYEAKEREYQHEIQMAKLKMDHEVRLKEMDLSALAAESKKDLQGHPTSRQKILTQILCPVSAKSISFPLKTTHETLTKQLKQGGIFSSEYLFDNPLPVLTQQPSYTTPKTEKNKFNQFSVDNSSPNSNKWEKPATALVDIKNKTV